MTKRIAIYCGLMMFLAFRCAFAQVPASNPSYHYEVGIFAEDLRFGRISPTLDLPGAGARIALFPQSWFQLEAEAAYDFSETFTTSWTNGFVTDSLTTHLRVASGLAGAKLDKRFWKKKMRLFATVKAGFVDFTSSTANIPQGFTNPQQPATGGGTDFLLYPGGGLEYSFGRWGLRFDAGDDLYFDHGHHYNNIKGAFGPIFRF